MAFSLVGEETSFCRACGVDKAPRTGSYGHCNCLVLGFYCQNYQTVICVSGSFLIVCTYIRRRQWHPTPVLLPGKSHGWRSLEGCSPRVAEGWTRLSDFTFTFPFHALEKEMATHSSVLAWRIPGMAEPGGLPSMGSHRVEHD